ncbi:tyrosine-type recombinase/integrase [Lactobacillus mulieris]|uniref:tyrosine-type recombinase/integrase n=1 Tax=Lactobacillus mulieris TaxID=2508708 RepID=UPI002243F7C5|nr:tyrosine-type recombinase/integrase [Lactobacillus mulieris]MCW8103705.1 tyrosine-type recombinase/integrase [Lactobacillus mulieris]MDK6802760.1 tyrosine-type recombinase/integrase [Lactobacillus mulieris]MDK8381876.1 tyrosine-type recombinase/integrase [Lactobacillus mulieris]
MLKHFFFHTYTGKYLSLSKPMKWLEAIYNKAPKDLKHIIVHGFRHTFASLLNPYIKPSDVQAILGHETVEMTLNIYTHVTNQSKKKVAQSINDLNI